MTNNKKIELSVINIIATVAVVILHANGHFWEYRDDTSWVISNVIECVFYFAVPLFFMMTGITLMDYRDRYDTKTFFKKRFSRTVVPFLFWSLVAGAMKAASDPHRFFENELAFDKIFNGIFDTQYLSIYWFFVPLFCIYLMMPLFASIEKERKVRVLTYIAGVAFIINTLIPFIINVANPLFGIHLSWNYSISVAAEYLFYVIVGYLLVHYQPGLKIRVVIYVLAAAGLAVHIFGTWYLSAKHGDIREFFKGYTNLPCILYSTGVFVFLRQVFSKIASEKAAGIIFRLQSYTFPIFLMHMILYVPLSSALEKIGLDKTSPLFVAAATVILIPACMLITFILRKIPVVRKIVP